MSDLGEIGRVREPEEPATFGYFGKRLRTNPTLTDFQLIDLVGRLSSAGDMDPERPEDIGRMARMLRSMVDDLVHADDVEAFWETARANFQEIEDIGDACGQIIAGVAGRPTVRPSDSSDGPQRTSESSAAGSSSPVIDRYLAQGRPDLALGVLRLVEGSEPRSA